MKHPKLLALVALIPLVASLAACNQSAPAGRSSARIDMLEQATKDPAKRSGLATLKTVYAQAEFHQASIEKAAVLLAGADHNLASITRAGQMMGRIGFHTLVLLGVAEAAAQATQDRPEFDQLLDLAIRKLGDSQSVIEAAKLAAGLAPGADSAALQAEIKRLEASAECASVDEAIARVAAMQEEIKRAANH